jgi:hypothetical protein
MQARVPEDHRIDQIIVKNDIGLLKQLKTPHGNQRWFARSSTHQVHFADIVGHLKNRFSQRQSRKTGGARA